MKSPSPVLTSDHSDPVVLFVRSLTVTKSVIRCHRVKTRHRMQMVLCTLPADSTFLPLVIFTKDFMQLLLKFSCLFFMTLLINFKNKTKFSIDA